MRTKTLYRIFIITIVAILSLQNKAIARHFSISGSINPIKTIAFTYDKSGNIKTYNDSITSAEYCYDEYNRKISETVNYGTFKLSYSYTYQKNNKKKSITYPDGTTYEYSYDNNNQLESIIVPSEGYIKFKYNSYLRNKPASITLPDGTRKEYAYDLLMRLKKIDVKGPEQNPLMTYNYQYSFSGNIIIKNTEHGNYAYEYDESYRLIQATNPVISGEAYTYDTVGNRLTSAACTKPWIYNQNNELLGYDTASFEYDNNGNMSKKNIRGRITNYIYNAENRLVLIKKADGAIIAKYYYDPFGRRLWKDIKGVRTYFFYSDEGLIAEYDANGTEIKSYGYIPDSAWTANPIYQKIGYKYYWYLNDHLGTPQKIIDSSGRVVWAAIYYTFGNIKTNVKKIENNLRFPGQYYDVETGFHYNYQRYYDPTAGRYLSIDPIEYEGKDFTLYSYAKNNPITYIDSLGLKACGPDWLPGVFDWPGGFDFTEACEFHDCCCACIGDAHAYECNLGFYVRMKNICDKEFILFRTECYEWALVYFGLASTYCQSNKTDCCDPKYKCEDYGFIICPPGKRLNPETCECEDVPPTPPPPPPDDPDGPDDDGEVFVPRSVDPNKKQGPTGFSEERVVAGDQLLPYTIYFENMPDATAPAQQVRITDQIDPNLDWRTFRLREIGFGDRVISVPENRSFYQTRLELGPEYDNLLLNIDAGIDIISGQAHWILTAIDPETGEQPENPMHGFLPPNDPNYPNPKGEGYVTYTIKSAKGLPSGTRIINKATIIFDRNEPIETNEVSNTVDGQAPSSQIEPVEPQIDGNSIQLTWSGTDDSGGSGLDDYTIYMSRDNGPYSPWLTNTKDTSVTFAGEKGHRYGFYSLARDLAGNIEDTPSVPDAAAYLILGNIDISGEITYTGPQTGTFYVEAYTDANFISPPVARVSLDAPGLYTIYQIPGEDIYYLRAFCDSNNNGIHDSWEAAGLCRLNPIDPAGDVTDADIILADPDIDKDGLPDWWEQQIVNADPADTIQSIQDVLPVGDYDLDGLSNEAEYLGGSVPSDPDSVAGKPAGVGQVKISDAGLLVAGNPYIIKAVMYLPAPIGHHPATYDVYQPEHYNRDLPLLRQMGCNTIVAWPGIDKLEFLNACWNDGNNPVRVIMGYSVDPNLDFADQDVRQSIVDDFKAYVSYYYAHPAVLMWQVCGWDPNLYQGDPADWYTLINALGWAAYQIEGPDYHPVTNDNMEVPDIGKAGLYTDDVHLTGLDCWGVGAVPATTFADLFTDYAARSSKPFWIFGFGIDAWDHTIGVEDEYTQAKFNGILWDEISTHLDICIGGAVKEYSDQWWISDPENIDQWATHEPGPYESPDIPDGWIDAEYFGLVRLTLGENVTPDQVTPRLSYYHLASKWREGNDPPMAVNTYIEINEDKDIDIFLLGLDGDSDLLVFSIIDEPAHGSLGDIFENRVSYTPGSDYKGQDIFTFKTFDGESDSDIATVYITILPVNDPPEVLSISPAAGEYKDPVSLAASFQDIEGDEILSINYEYSVDNGQTWINIGENTIPSAPYEWLSGLNTAQVFIRAMVYDGQDWSAWYINPSGFMIDNIPPLTTDDAPQGWQYQCVTIHLTPSDEGSGFDGPGATYYFIDGNAPQEGKDVSICTPDIHELYYYSVDDAGNIEEEKSVQVFIAWDQDKDSQFDISCGGTDCDDTDPNIYLGAQELCDGKDNDCDGKTDENCLQIIPLREDWNLISFPVNTCWYDTNSPPYVNLPSCIILKRVSSLKNVLSSIDGKYLVISSYDIKGGHTFDPALDGLGFNDLHYLSGGYGYWIKMKEEASLHLHGGILDPNCSLTLTSDWNLTGYWGTDARHDTDTPPEVPLPEAVIWSYTPSLLNILNSIDEKYQFISSYDLFGGHTFDPAFDGLGFNDLHYLAPGYGYWIKMIEQGELRF